MSTAIAPVANMQLAGDAFSNPAVYEHVKSIAGLLANGAYTPKHLIASGNPGRTLATCSRIVIQALRWGMDIFSVADETYEVHGRLGYQGKLIIAVVNARAGLKGRLRFDYTGTGQDMKVIVSGTFKDEDEPRKIEVSVKQAKTTNEMWTKDPEQKLAYTGAIKWARRHSPELILGVDTREDLEYMADNGTLTAHCEAVAPAKPKSLGDLTASLTLPAPQEPTPEQLFRKCLSEIASMDAKAAAAHIATYDSGDWKDEWHFELNAALEGKGAK